MDESHPEPVRDPEPCNDYLGGLTTTSADCPRCRWPIHEHPPEPRLVEWLEERRTQPISPDPYDLPALPSHLRAESI